MTATHNKSKTSDFLNDRPSSDDIARAAASAGIWAPIGRAATPGRPTVTDMAMTICAGMGERLWYNSMSGEIIFDGKPLASNKYRLAYAHFEHLGYKMTPERAGDALQLASHERSRHPIQEYLKGCRTPLPPDDWANIASKLLGPGMTSFDNVLLQRWLIHAVARVMRPGSPFGILPILAGGQGMHKTRFFGALGGEWFLGGFQKSRNDTDDLISMSRKWIIEWAELDGGLTKHSSADLKAFIDKQDDTYRRPYAKDHETVPRSFVLSGTSNHTDGILVDETGNRRYALIRILEKINIEQVQELRERVWASAMVEFKAGTQWWLTEAENEINNTRNRGLMVEDMWTEIIQEKIFGANRESFICKTTANNVDAIRQQALLKAIEPEVARLGTLHGKRLGAILRQLGFERVTRKINGGPNYSVPVWVPRGSAAE